jgi:hypothetical protein
MLRQTKPVATVVSLLQKRFLSSTPSLRAEVADITTLHEIPGDARRRILDPRRKQAKSESPYGGHPHYNPPPPGVCYI